MDKLLNVLLTLLLRYVMIKPPVQRESANGGWKERGGGQTKLLTNQEGVRAKLLGWVLPNISSYDAHCAASPSQNNCTVPKG